MTYTIHQIQQLTAKSGKNYQRADLTDMNGQVYEGVSAFNGEFRTEGISLDGILESSLYNGKTSYVFKSKPSTTQGGKTAQMEKIMDKKSESISNFQDAKEKSIQHAGTITNSTNYLRALVKGIEFDSLEAKDDYMRNKLRETMVFYHNLYKYPENINPSSHESPDF